MLPELLQQAVDEGRALLGLLDEEWQTLRSRDLDAMEACRNRKMASVARMQTLTESIDRLLGQAGHAPGPNGMQAAIQALPAHRRADTTRLWHSLRDIGQAVHNQNERNGMLIGAGLQHCQRAIAILQGRIGPSLGLYGNDHRPGGSGPGGRPLAKA